jgi:spore maturation protein SpmB
MRRTDTRVVVLFAVQLSLEGSAGVFLALFSLHGGRGSLCFVRSGLLGLCACVFVCVCVCVGII